MFYKGVKINKHLRQLGIWNDILVTVKRTIQDWVELDVNKDLTLREDDYDNFSEDLTNRITGYYKMKGDKMRNALIYRYACLDCKKEVDIIFLDYIDNGSDAYCSYCGKKNLEWI